MPGGLSLAIALLAEVAAPPAASAAAAAEPVPTAVASVPPAYGPVQSAAPKPPVRMAETPMKAADRCPSAPPTTDANEIIVCAQRPQGYRLDPDVMEAKRAMRSGRPKRPERMRDNSCASVGPMGCGGGGVDIAGAAIVAGMMLAKALRGENVGEMFITDPQPTEYELYVEAKRRREAKEAEAAAAAKAKVAQARAANPEIR